MHVQRPALRRDHGKTLSIIVYKWEWETLQFVDEGRTHVPWGKIRQITCLFGPHRLQSSPGKLACHSLGVTCAPFMASWALASLQLQGAADTGILTPQHSHQGWRGSFRVLCRLAWMSQLPPGLFPQRIIITCPPCCTYPRLALPLGPVSSPLLSCSLLYSTSPSHHEVPWPTTRFPGSKRTHR